MFNVYGVIIDKKWFTAIYEMAVVEGEETIVKGPIAIHEPSAVNTHGPLVLHDSEEQAESAGNSYIKQDFLKRSNN